MDVLHTHGYKADIYGLAARSQRMALIATCHNWPDPHPVMRVYAMLDRWILKCFDKVAAVSEPVAEILRRSGVQGADAVPNGIDLARFAGASPALRPGVLDSCDRLIGFVGRLVKEKGGAVLLEAARRVLAERPKTGFVFIGEGPERAEWEKTAATLQIAGNVAFTGSRSDMPGVYASLDALVLPSLNEAMPMCLLEAMAAGCPVLATRVGSVEKLVIHDRTGRRCIPESAGGCGRDSPATGQPRAGS